MYMYSWKCDVSIRYALVCFFSLTMIDTFAPVSLLICAFILSKESSRKVCDDASVFMTISRILPACCLKIVPVMSLTFSELFVAVMGS